MAEFTEKHSRLLDKQFGKWVASHFGHGDKTIGNIATAVSYATSLKHTCLDLELYQQLGEPVLDGLLKGITPDHVKKQLDNSVRPLVCSPDGKKIWLQKYHAFETGVAMHLQKLAKRKKQNVSENQQVLLGKLFDKKSAEHCAVATKAMEHQLAIITGGPGTGKTWTVARLIVLLMQENPQWNIQLAAPTGKAGARMMESLRAAFNQDGVMKEYVNLLAKLPQKAPTLDSLLKISYESPKARKGKQDPLTCDVLIVDEASMIALPMMYRLLEALPETTRLILLGDKDQLASVEAGSVLGDICASESLRDCIAVITSSHRFGEGSEIGELAKALNQGEVKLAEKPETVFVHTTDSAGDPWKPVWLQQAVDEYKILLEHLKPPADTAEDEQVLKILALQNRFQILCALREGPCGVSGINSMVAEALRQKTDGWYEGRPVIITQNDHARKLYNGDVGLVLKRKDAAGNEMLKACFLSGNKIKEISQAQMPPHETCYAMTVHKSQGSEYDHVCIVLPDAANDLSPVLTRELVYTAVTRAKDSIDIWCGENVLQESAKSKMTRMSGLQGDFDG